MDDPRVGLRGSLVPGHEVQGGDSAGLVGDARGHGVASYPAGVQHGLGVVRVGAVAEGAFRCGSTSRWCSARLPVGE